MTINEILITLLIGYTLGNIQTSYFMGRLLKQIDIREHGSGNVGASNAVMVLGWKPGLIAGLIDMGKAAAAVLLIRALYPGDAALPYLAGSGAIFGHLYPFYLGLRGGKGVASLVGMFFGLNLWWGLFCLGALISIALLTDYIEGGSLFIFAVFPLVTWQLGHPPLCIVFAAFLAAICFYKHRGNIRRVINKTEVTISEEWNRQKKS